MEINFTFEGIVAGQTPGVEIYFRKILFEFDRIIEIGTYTGGLTLFLYRNMKENAELISYDINPTYNQVPKQHKIDFRIGDCFSEQIINEIKDLISDKSKRILLLCDGGNKNKEFNLFSQYLKTGDVIMCHDYSESIEDFDAIAKNIGWRFSTESNLDAIAVSIKNNNLSKYHYNEFKSVLWGSFIKN